MTANPIRTYFEIVEADPTVRAHLVELLRTAAVYSAANEAVSRELAALAHAFCDHVRAAPGGSCRYCGGHAVEVVN